MVLSHSLPFMVLTGVPSQPPRRAARTPRGAGWGTGRHRRSSQRTISAMLSRTLSFASSMSHRKQSSRWDASSA